MNKNTYESFLQLVRVGIGTTKGVTIPKDVDWVQLKALADKQGLTAVVLDGLDKCNADMLSLQLKLEWIGEVLQNYEQRYKQYEQAISSLAGFYNQHGFKMMVIKGYGLSLNYPKPAHRPCGDIDIWLFGQQETADKELVSSFKVQESRFKIDASHHHHTVFEWEGFTVENHYDFVNVHHSKSNAQLEKIFKELGADDSHSVVVDGEKVYLPSPNLHALFLLRHMMIEFAASSASLRQLVDWALFAKKYIEQIDRVWLEDTLERYGMKRLYDVFNAICVGDLGFDVNIFPKVQFDPSIKDKVLNEILSPAVPNDKPKNVFSRIAWKWHRWKANEWKHELVYKESMHSAFWSGVWNHLLKPSSI